MGGKRNETNLFSYAEKSQQQFCAVIFIVQNRVSIVIYNRIENSYVRCVLVSSPINNIASTVYIGVNVGNDILWFTYATVPNVQIIYIGDSKTRKVLNVKLTKFSLCT